MEHLDRYEHQDSQPSPEELELIAALEPWHIQAIDAALLAKAEIRWRKVAYLVGVTMNGPSYIPGVPDIYYAQRIRELVSRGALEAQGDLSRMRYSEVRLPVEDVSSEA